MGSLSRLLLAAVRVRLSDQQLEIRLSLVERVLGLLGDITVPLADVSDVQIVDDPLHEVMRTGLKVGLRLPWLYYVCRTIRLDRAWAVRRGVPALSFAVRNQGVLERVTVSTPEARDLVRRLADRRR
jgi:FAD/FMN-containing dehydrogenase